MSTPTNANQDGVDRLLAFLDLSESISKLSDLALSTRVMNEVWGRLPMGSPQDALTTEMISRFERLSGIQRNEMGEVIEPQQKPYWVIRREDGTFVCGITGSTKSLPEANRYATHAEALISSGGEETVIEVRPNEREPLGVL